MTSATLLTGFFYKLDGSLATIQTRYLGRADGQREENSTFIAHAVLLQQPRASTHYCAFPAQSHGHLGTVKWILLVCIIKLKSMLFIPFRVIKFIMNMRSVKRLVNILGLLHIFVSIFHVS